MQEVQLTPFQGLRRTVGGVERVWLHPLDMANVLDVVGGGVAARASKRSWSESKHQRRYDADAAHSSHDVKVEVFLSFLSFPFLSFALLSLPSSHVDRARRAGASSLVGTRQEAGVRKLEYVVRH